MKKIMSNWIAGLITIVMVFGLVVVVLLQGTNASGTPTLQETTPDMENEEIARLRRLLAKDDLSAEDRRGLEEKLEMAERMAAEQAAPRQPRSTKIAPPQSFSAQYNEQEPAFTEGIFEGSEGLIRPSLADIANLWQGSRNGKQMQVFAGAFSENLGGEGVIIVMDLLPDKPIGTMTNYPAPDGTGPLRIVEVGESEVVLQTVSGDRLIFDLTSRSFQ
jgi:hypothetical protein